MRCGRIQFQKIAVEFLMEFEVSNEKAKPRIESHAGSVICCLHALSDHDVIL